MHLTRFLRQADKQSYKSLALSVYFAHPQLTQGRQEILSRATAFLYGVDPPPPKLPAGTYSHLDAAERRRKERHSRQTHKHTPASGPGTLQEMGWLEYVPKEARPQVHVVASSHVISPFLWKEYYPLDWLNHVRQEHCSYALEVFDGPAVPERKPVIKLALHPTPYHHPEGRDIALIHLKEEGEALQLLRNIGVDILHLRDTEKLFKKGETMLFDGYAVEELQPTTGATDAEAEPAVTPAEADDDCDLSDEEEDEQGKENNAAVEDRRIFQPYTEEGSLAFHTEDRFFATTPKPLPEGLCGAPVLDTDGELCGVVEGIVPVTHENPRLAGSAAFMPYFQVAAFVDYCERQMLQNLMPPDMFQMVVNAKKTNAFGGGPYKQDNKGEAVKSDWEEAHKIMVDNLKEKYTKDEVEAFLQLIRDESEEVMKRMQADEEADMDEIIAQVRSETLASREKFHAEFHKAREEAKKNQQE